MHQEIQQKTFKFVESFKEEINFKAPTEEFAPADQRQTSLCEPEGTHTQYLCMLPM